MVQNATLSAVGTGSCSESTALTSQESQPNSSTNPNQVAPTDLDVASPSSSTSVDSDGLPTDTSENDTISTFPPLDLPGPGMAILTSPLHPSVLDWYWLYRGYYYCIPPPTVAPSYYMVTKGLHVGIFSGWKIAGSLNIKVCGFIQYRVPSVESGVNLFEKALEETHAYYVLVKSYQYCMLLKSYDREPIQWAITWNYINRSYRSI
ncbi:hypothetical protein HD554DRAFT_2035512 [Boletus coccyginus]|nr:hypothetical protein HD554DRAFT_2035512 [Boletus coccyginus]